MPPQSGSKASGSELYICRLQKRSMGGGSERQTGTSSRVAITMDDNDVAISNRGGGNATGGTCAAQDPGIVERSGLQCFSHNNDESCAGLAMLSQPVIIVVDVCEVAENGQA